LPWDLTGDQRVMGQNLGLQATFDPRLMPQKYKKILICEPKSVQSRDGP